MEYVFGPEEGIEILKTKGNGHSGLNGFHEIERSYPDQVITDRFYVSRLIRSDTDDDGNVYDWYEITDHNRYVDKFSPHRNDIESGISDAQDATCELSEELDERISAVEDALCELSIEG